MFPLIFPFYLCTVNKIFKAESFILLICTSYFLHKPVPTLAVTTFTTEKQIVATKHFFKLVYAYFLLSMRIKATLFSLCFEWYLRVIKIK